MRSLAALCYLALRFLQAEGIDLPTPKYIEYESGERLHFELSFSSLPQPPAGQHWSSTVYRRDATNSTSIISGPTTHLLLVETHSAGLQLGLADDGAALGVRLQAADGAPRYRRDVVRLALNPRRPDEEKDSCLKSMETCKIVVDSSQLSAVPPDEPFTSISPAGSVALAAGGAVRVACRAHGVPDNYKLIMYKNFMNVSEVIGGELERTIVADGALPETAVYCVAHYVDSSPKNRKSATLTLRLKDDPVRVVTEPALRNVTYYRDGDVFSYTCSGGGAAADTVFSWIRVEDEHRLNVSRGAVALRLPLDASYHRVAVRCQAAGSRAAVATTLYRVERERRPAVPWLTLGAALAAGGACGLAALGAAACARRAPPAPGAPGRDRSERAVEVQNELYGLTYAELYEQRPGAPPARERAPYAAVVGYLQ